MTSASVLTRSLWYMSSLQTPTHRYHDDLIVSGVVFL